MLRISPAYDLVLFLFCFLSFVLNPSELFCLVLICFVFVFVFVLMCFVLVLVLVLMCFVSFCFGCGLFQFCFGLNC